MSSMKVLSASAAISLLLLTAQSVLPANNDTASSRSVPAEVSASPDPRETDEIVRMVDPQTVDWRSVVMRMPAVEPNGIEVSLEASWSDESDEVLSLRVYIGDEVVDFSSAELREYHGLDIMGTQLGYWPRNTDGAVTLYIPFYDGIQLKRASDHFLRIEYREESGLAFREFRASPEESLCVSISK